MKGKMKKLVAFALATIMVLAMGITAAAADKTITVTDTVKDAKYNLYKVFNATTDGAGHYNYTVPDDSPIPSLNETQKAAFDAVFTTKNTGGETYVEANTGVTESQIAAYLQANISSVGILMNGTPAVADGENDVTFTVADDGYYYVSSTVNSGAAAMVSTATGDITIHEKNDLPGFGDGGKTADNTTYYIGDTVHYTVAYNNALNYADGEKIYRYVVKDNPQTGISIVENTVTIKIGGEDPVANSYTGSITGQNGLVINWTTDGTADGDFLYTAPTTIVIEYDAVVTSSAVVGQNGNDNTVSINYNEAEPTTDTEKVYTGSITINKYDAADNRVALVATFVIANETEDAYLVENTEEDGPKYDFTATDVAGATKFVTTNGQVIISGLKAGTYKLIEVEAPDGYNLKTDPTTVTLSVPEDGAETDTLASIQGIENNQGSQLPSTGGIGTTIFYVVGGILVVGAGILLITKKRMSKSN